MAPSHPLDPGARLKLAREAKGVSTRQVAESTKLSVRAIEALESGRVSALPEGIYRRSIIRLLATEVGLNPDQLLREFSVAHPVDLPAPSGPCAVVEVPKGRQALQGVIAFLGACFYVDAFVMLKAKCELEEEMGDIGLQLQQDALDVRREK